MSRPDIVHDPLHHRPIRLGHRQVIHPVVGNFFDPLLVQFCGANFLNMLVPEPLNPGQMKLANVLDREGLQILFFIHAQNAGGNAGV